MQAIAWLLQRPLVKKDDKQDETIPQKKSSFKVVTWGFHGGGATTGLYQLKLGEDLTSHHGPLPIGVDFHKFEVDGTSLQFWDFGGRERFRVVSRAFFRKADALVFYVDATERASDRHEFIRDAMDNILSEHELRGVPMLICANKQDLPNAMTAGEVTEALRLSELQGRAWHVQATSAKTGDGLREGVSWLLRELRQNNGTLSEEVVGSGKVWLEGLVAEPDKTTAAPTEMQQPSTVNKQDQGLLQVKAESGSRFINDGAFLKQFGASSLNPWHLGSFFRQLW